MGTPADYESAYYQINSLIKFEEQINSQNNSSSNMGSHYPCLLPMAGKGSRFKMKGFSTPKQFLPLFEGQSSQYSLTGLNISELHIGVLQSNLDAAKSAFKNATSFTVLSDVLNGQALTCKHMLMDREFQGPFIITACDSSLTLDCESFYKAIDRKDFDIIVVVCSDNPATNKKPEAYSWVIYDKDENVTSVHCKKSLSSTDISNNKIGHIDGTFVFKDKELYLDLVGELETTGFSENLGEFYVDELLALALNKGLKIKSFRADHYLCFGTPEEYNEICYYYNCIKSLKYLKKKQ